jgi:hypothetical protein
MSTLDVVYLWLHCNVCIRGLVQGLPTAGRATTIQVSVTSYSAIPCRVRKVEVHRLKVRPVTRCVAVRRHAQNRCGRFTTIWQTYNSPAIDALWQRLGKLRRQAMTTGRGKAASSTCMSLSLASYRSSGDRRVKQATAIGVPEESMQIGYSGCAYTAPLRGRLTTESRVDAPLIVVGSKSAQLVLQVNVAPEEDLIKVLPPHGSDEPFNERVRTWNERH